MVRKIVFASTLALTVLLIAARAVGQTKTAWLDKEFSDPAAVPVQATESFINDTCQPSGLDGFQMLAVQKGETDVYHLHLYCRQDKAASTHYKVTMPVIATGSVFAAIKALLDDPNARIGPFYFGKTRAQDSFLLVEKTH